MSKKKCETNHLVIDLYVHFVSNEQSTIPSEPYTSTFAPPFILRHFHISS